MFDRHVATQEEMWHGFFAPRIMQLEDMTRRELDAVPTPSAFTAQPPPADLVPPILGLGAALAAAVLVYRLSQPALRQ
jgi:hypothetical protein